jgi:hypothetical protein
MINSDPMQWKEFFITLRIHMHSDRGPKFARPVWKIFRPTCKYLDYNTDNKASGNVVLPTASSTGRMWCGNGRDQWVTVGSVLILYLLDPTREMSSTCYPLPISGSNRRPVLAANQSLMHPIDHRPHFGWVRSERWSMGDTGGWTPS